MKTLPWLLGPALLTLSLSAEAAPRSLSAAIAQLPAATEGIVTSHVKAARSTKLVETVLLARLNKARGANEAIEKVKKLCKIDPVKAIEDATLALTKDDEGGGFIALDGIDEKKAVDCALSLAKDEFGAKAKAEKVDQKPERTIYKLSADGSKDAAFFAWLPTGVVVIASDPEDKAKLEALLGGKGSLAKSSALSARLGKLDASAALSAIFAKERTIEGKTVKGGNVTVKIESGQVRAVGGVEFAKSADAREMASLVSALQGMLGKMARGVSLDASASGSELSFKAEAPEADLIKLIEESLGKRRF